MFTFVCETLRVVSKGRTVVRGPKVFGKASENPLAQNVASVTLSAMNSFKVIIERHSDGYVAYPVGLNGAVVGDGDSIEAALANVESAIRFHLETFGKDALGEQTDQVLLADVSV